MGNLLVALVVVVGVLLALYWLIYVAEGSYAGAWLVRWLYDRGAPTYDAVKGFSPADEFAFLGKPLFDRLEEALGEGGPGLVLDVATGTGRLPLALLDIPFFTGALVGVDASFEMLAQAAHKRAQRELDARWALLHHPAAPLPFADEAFDAVTMLEALEFLPDRDAAIAEMVRVLRPGGWLLISNRIGLDARLMPGRTDSPAQFEKRLAAHGLTEIFTRPWQTYYDLVWARKPGSLTPRPLPDWRQVLQCPQCYTVGAWDAPAPETHKCRTCGMQMRLLRGVWTFQR
ncbi:class I SAM-dependent methyltransferase [Ardenticatena maritima]|nr:class I SAM-dependent methyltransferase [Ardenticatena maritima]